MATLPVTFAFAFIKWATTKARYFTFAILKQPSWFLPPSVSLVSGVTEWEFKLITLQRLKMNLNRVKNLSSAEYEPKEMRILLL